MNLERAKDLALERLAATAPEGELRVSPNGESGYVLWLGLGYAVAAGWASYRGTDGPWMFFRCKPAGREAWRARQATLRTPRAPLTIIEDGDGPEAA